MAQQKININMHRGSIYYLMLCLFGVMVFVFAGIIPTATSIDRFSKKMTQLNDRIKEHNALKPTYDTLVKSVQGKDTRVLPLPARKKLSRTEIETVFSTFKEIGVRAGVDTVSINPDLNLMAKEPGSMVINTSFRGEFLNFRKVLIGIGALPYVESIDGITIDHTLLKKDMRVKVRLAVEG